MLTQIGQFWAWMKGEEKPNSMLQDEVWMVLTWKKLQPQDEDSVSMVPVALLLMISLMLPLFAFANTSTSTHTNTNNPAHVTGAAKHASPFKAAAVYEVPVPIQRIQAGTRLTADLFELREVRAVSRSTLTDIEDLAGLEARRSLRAGAPISENAVQIVPDVRKNGMVKLIYKGTGLKLDTLGKALESGKIGDLVRAQNIDSNKTVTGLVSAHNTITMNLTNLN